MNKLFGKMAVILTVLGSGLVLEEMALADDIFATEPPTAAPPPATVVQDRELTIEPALENLTGEPSPETESMEQVTSVSQLSDVQPMDWAFQALQSLVERYGCIEGYPDRTYRGNRAMTRYEFAAGLNACLDRVNELIQAATANLPAREDIATIRRLQEEFAAELATLRGRVDALEARTAAVEANRFSTTTKLFGQVITYLGDAFGENAGPINNATLSYQAYLTFLTSFTGKDSLIVGLEASNINRFNPGVQFPDSRANSQFGISGLTDETRLFFSGRDIFGFPENDITLSQLQYRFPLGNNLTVSLDAFASNRVLSAPITPLNNFTTGAVSFYGRINPMLYPVFQQSAIGVQWQIAPWLGVDFSLGSDFAANNPREGLWDGGYSASVRPVLNLGRFKLTASYLNTYAPDFGIDTASGSNPAKVVGAGPVIANTYVVGAFYRFSPVFELGGSVGYSTARALGDGTKGDAQVWDYRVNLIFYDLGKKGNLAGLIFGTQPRLTGTSNDAIAQAIGLPAGQRSDRDVGFHIEAFYAYRLTDNIAITPGVVWLTAPNHDERNPDVVIGVIRTTFDF